MGKGSQKWACCVASEQTDDDDDDDDDGDKEDGDADADAVEVEEEEEEEESSVDFRASPNRGELGVLGVASATP